MRKLAPLLILAVICLGCASGTVTTSTGAVVSAGTVQAQNTAGDILKMLSDSYIQAVAIHDSPSVVAADSPTTHASRHLLLVQVHDGLVAAYAAEIAWKQTSTSSAVPPAVLCALKTSLIPFLNLAVDFKLLTAAQSSSVITFSTPILATVGGCS
jgi:hypothetical protein